MPETFQSQSQITHKSELARHIVYHCIETSSFTFSAHLSFLSLRQTVILLQLLMERLT